MEEQIGDVQLNLMYYSGVDLYSDGNIEDDLLNICREGTMDNALHVSDFWPILYHLSPNRENLLEWYEFGEHASILEIGSGCGALTGLLCRQAEKVTCVELSKKRSMINAYKNRGCNNLRIYVGNFADIKFGELFDYITLIGVLEYSPSYINSLRPFHDFLSRLKKLLKHGGKIVIAIENRLGLKYWSGAYEDHTGVLFSGLEYYKDHKTVKTFTKPELLNLLKACGLSDCEFYYPMPDYKLPYIIYSDRHQFKTGDIRNISQVYDNDCFKLFSEEILFDTLCNDGLFGYFANSFLVFCGRDEDLNLCEK